MRHYYFWYIAVWYYRNHYCAEPVRLESTDNLTEYADKTEHFAVCCVGLYPQKSRRDAEDNARARNMNYINRCNYMGKSEMYAMARQRKTDRFTKGDVK